MSQCQAVSVVQKVNVLISSIIVVAVVKRDLN